MFSLLKVGPTQNISGQWSDEDGTLVSNIIDFGGQFPGSYAFTYTTTVGDICPDTSATAVVVVADCSCPENIFTNNLELCQREAIIMLESIFQDSIYFGNWQVGSVSGILLPVSEDGLLTISETL